MFKLRLTRPVLHFLIINCLFFLTYKVRFWTDFIPGVQLPIPFINATELIIFSIIASAGFIGIGIIKDFYCLNKRVINHFQTFSKVWIYWFISITFLSYFGQGFIFFFGISRFILIFTGLLTYIVLFFFDQGRRALEYQQQKKSWKKILIISWETIDTYEILKTIKANFSLQTEFISPDEAEETDFWQYEMCVVVWNFKKDQLQAIFEKTRFFDTRFFHISEGFFLEDVVYKPEIIQNIIALEYKHSKLDGRSLVVKRIFDVVWAVVGIILLSPALLVIAIAITLKSLNRRSAFYLFEVPYDVYALKCRIWRKRSRWTLQKAYQFWRQHQRGRLTKDRKWSESHQSRKIPTQDLFRWIAAAFLCSERDDVVGWSKTSPRKRSCKIYALAEETP